MHLYVEVILRNHKNTVLRKAFVSAIEVIILNGHFVLAILMIMRIRYVAIKMLYSSSHELF